MWIITTLKTLMTELFLIHAFFYNSKDSFNSAAYVKTLYGDNINVAFPQVSVPRWKLAETTVAAKNPFCAVSTMILQ